MRKLIALFVGAIVCLPTVARAEKERKSPLTDAPVIRRRLELRDKRFEFGVGAGVSIGQDFYNALLVTPKLSYHFNDWLSLAAMGGFNLLPGWKSSFNTDVNGALPKDHAQESIKSPYADVALGTMNHIGWLVAGQVEFIPLSGKIAILSSLFSYFDFYVLGGAGLVNLAASNSMPQDQTNCTVSNPPGCKAHTATELMFNSGLGVHAYVSRFAAINIELHDFIYKNNASGRDVNGDHVTTNDDLEWTNNWVCNLNVQFFLPYKAKISR
jgi:outer membrane beta-barrel protein